MSYAAVGIIIDNQDADLLLHLRDDNTPNMTNQWCLIAGTIDDSSEDILSTAVRETKEETALTLLEPQFIKSFEFKGKYVALIKGSVNTDKETMILGEGAELRFIPRKDIKSFLSSLPYSNAYLDAFASYLDEYW